MIAPHRTTAHGTPSRTPPPQYTPRTRRYASGNASHAAQVATAPPHTFEIRLPQAPPQSRSSLQLPCHAPHTIVVPKSSLHTSKHTIRRHVKRKRVAIVPQPPLGGVSQQQEPAHHSVQSSTVITLVAHHPYNEPAIAMMERLTAHRCFFRTQQHYGTTPKQHKAAQRNTEKREQ